ncbi:MAG: hypothetical protein IT318_06405 [Anaerolineales bacterium]|nr:hypothetical protein [Anaerolineales bacterium]
MSETTGKKSERFSTVVTVLIAVVSTVIALVASQAAVASGDATEAQHNGVLAKINLERVDGGSWTQIARNRRAFNDYRVNRDLYSLTFDYITQAEAEGSSPLGTRLRLEAAGQLEESNGAYRFIDSGYLIADEAGEYVGLDEPNFINDKRQTAAIYQDIDYDDNFADANRFRTEGLYLGATLFVWFLSLMFLTWAEITKSALRWVWLAAGVLIALGLVAAYVVSGMISALGLG